MAIKELDRLTAEQIAAGEVIENPASVVKELIENALDAGATAIEIKVEEGGKAAVVVTDNGAGIDPAELPLAFKRFATSKLAALDDLDTLASLGFRGEALPSIAAVARVTLTTRLKGSDAGARIRLAGGEVISREETGAPEGTAVGVRDLFYNTPGRLKFLRAAPVEMGRITTLVSNLALARPDVAFTLFSGPKTVLRTAGDGVLLHVIGTILGSECAGAMPALHYYDPGQNILITGHLSAPHLHRASRRWITVVINGRVVRNALVSGALERGYGTLLPRQRYPVAVIHLRVPPAELDVNVHPAKIEIRFHQPEKIKDLVYRAVRSTMQGPLPRLSPPALPQPEEPEGRTLPGYPGPAAPGICHENTGVFDTLDPGPKTVAIPPPGQVEPGSGSRGRAGAGFCSLIGQFLHSYLVVQKGEELLLVDQHAAHERVLYHALSAAGNEHILSRQLTLPLTVEVPPAWREPLEELLPILSAMGLNMEPFGDTSFIIRTLPFAARESISGAELYAMLEEMVTARPDPGEERRERIRKTVACHRAIKAGRPLTRVEMEYLLSEWRKTPDSDYCPHGRPAVISFSRGELEKGFRRKGG